MNLTQKIASTSYPYRTWSQLKKMYPDQWVLLINADTNPVGYAVKGGEVVFSDPVQEKVFEQAKTLPIGSRMDIIFTGNRELPSNTALCL